MHLFRNLAITLMTISALPLYAIVGFNDHTGDFNAVIFNNHTANGGDSEGRLAVGGNSTAVSSYSVGDRASPNSASYTSYLVRGNAGDFSQVYHGTTSIGGTWTGVGSSAYAISSNQGSAAANAIFDFDSAFNYMNSTSSSLAALSNQGTTWTQAETWDRPTLGVGADTHAVYNLSASNLAAAVSFGSINITGMDLTKTLVINVEGESINTGSLQVFVNSYVTGTHVDNWPETGFSSISNSTTADAPISRILWNFEDATSIDMVGGEWAGTVLAPQATLVLDGGSINGDVVVLNADQKGGGEFHADNYNRNPASANAGDNVYAFTGDVTSMIPELSSFSLITSCLAGSVVAMRRRRIS